MADSCCRTANRMGSRIGGGWVRLTCPYANVGYAACSLQRRLHRAGRKARAATGNVSGCRFFVASCRRRIDRNGESKRGLFALQFAHHAVPRVLDAAAWQQFRESVERNAQQVAVGVIDGRVEASHAFLDQIAAWDLIHVRPAWRQHTDHARTLWTAKHFAGDFFVE